MLVRHHFGSLGRLGDSCGGNISPSLPGRIFRPPNFGKHDIYKFLFLTCLCAITILGGCTTQYVPPHADSGPVARVRMLSKSSNPVWALKFKNACSSPSEFSNSELISYVGRSAYGPRHKSIGMPMDFADPKTTVFAETIVRAQEPVNLGFQLSSPHFDCLIGMQFTPLQDADYEVEFWREENMCFIELSRLKTDYGNKLIRQKNSNNIQLPDCK